MDIKMETDKTWKYFRIISDEPIKEEDAVATQIAKGFDPMGYGFYKFQTNTVGKQFITTWKCFASCD